MTKHFAKELADILAGPPKISQTEFARRAKMTKSKLSRLLSNTIACDQATIQSIVNALQHKEDKARMVNAYLMDVAGPQVLGALNGAHDPLEKLDTGGMSRKGKESLRKLVHSTHLKDAEEILNALVAALGL